VLLAFADPPDRRGGSLAAWLRRRIEHYEQSVRELNEVWKGNLVFGFLVVEAACIGLAAMIVVGRWIGWSSVTRMPQLFAYLGINAWWVLPLGVLATPLVLDLSRLLVASLARATRLSRATLALVAALFASGLLSFRYYPALADQLSPKDAFDAYRTEHAAGEPLGVWGLRPRVVRYYADDEDVHHLASASAALNWLEEGWLEEAGLEADSEPPLRRWLLIRSRDLAALNALSRTRGQGNVGVVHGDGRVLLLTTAHTGTAQGETAQSGNPLSELVLSSPPAALQHPVSATLDGRIETLGWEVRDARGSLVDFVVPGRRYDMRFFYRANQAVGRDYEAFIHIDGYQRRHNGDHAVLDGRYRTSLWRSGDVLVDHYVLTLEPNFLPGNYQVYYGLCAPCRDDKGRMRVTAGKHHNNRIAGGTIEVR
jgi:hypothetical protein